MSYIITAIVFAAFGFGFAALLAAGDDDEDDRTCCGLLEEN